MTRRHAAAARQTTSAERSRSCDHAPAHARAWSSRPTGVRSCAPAGRSDPPPLSLCSSSSQRARRARCLAPRRVPLLASLVVLRVLLSPAPSAAVRIYGRTDEQAKGIHLPKPSVQHVSSPRAMLSPEHRGRSSCLLKMRCAILPVAGKRPYPMLHSARRRRRDRTRPPPSCRSGVQR